MAAEVPGLPGGRRVLGHGLEFGRDPLALFQRAREHGGVVRIRFGPLHVYVLNSPDAIRQALVSQARKLEKGLNFGRTKRLIGNGLVMSEGEYHHRQRRLMQPAFHHAEIARYMSTMRDMAVPRIDGPATCQSSSPVAETIIVDSYPLESGWSGGSGGSGGRLPPGECDCPRSLLSGLFPR